jgi:hypothetical protein
MTARESIRPMLARHLVRSGLAALAVGLRVSRDARWYANRRLTRVA